MRTRQLPHLLVLLSALSSSLVCSNTARAECVASATPTVSGLQKSWRLNDGSIAGFSKMNINIDGSARAYHRNNAAAGALIHLCNAGRVYLPDGSSYEGSESDKTCTGKFMSDLIKIENAQWKDPSVGVISWYGILGKNSATIKGKTIRNVEPVAQQNHARFYVSPTSMYDSRVLDQSDQSRYLNPLLIPFATLPTSLKNQGVRLGSFGVAIHRTQGIAVPFVVGDAGPRVGEGSVALARRAAGLPLLEEINRAQRFDGQVETRDVLWVYFSGDTESYDHTRPNALIESANAAFLKWGGQERLDQCLATLR